VAHAATDRTALAVATDSPGARPGQRARSPATDRTALAVATDSLPPLAGEGPAWGARPS
jgi:hypothetical protein